MKYYLSLYLFININFNNINIKKLFNYFIIFIHDRIYYITLAKNSYNIIFYNIIVKRFIKK